jgi:hypothetical protein
VESFGAQLMKTLTKHPQILNKGVGNFQAMKPKALELHK